MVAEPRNADGHRRQMLRSMLIGLRDETYQRVKEFRSDPEQETESAPADEMDVARSTSDVELPAALIAREEEKLRFIDEAFSRLDAGKCGESSGCHAPVPIERISALPFATYCVDCQQRRNCTRRDWGEGATISLYDQQWTVPEEMEEPLEREG